MAGKTTTTKLPKTGDVYRCDECGMEVKLESDCHCNEGQPYFECCGQPLAKT